MSIPDSEISQTDTEKKRLIRLASALEALVMSGSISEGAKERTMDLAKKYGTGTITLEIQFSNTGRSPYAKIEHHIF